MVSVLGKRTRQEENATPCRSRVKRQSRGIYIHSDENAKPTSIQAGLSASKQAAQVLDSFHVSTPLKESISERPAKHGQLSGIGVHFKIAKQSGAAAEKNASKNVPVTPSHRDARTKVLVTPQSRIKSETPRTPTTDSTLGPYAQARQAFSGACDRSLLVGRGEERNQVSDFIESHIASSTGGCLYISGPPGTGKSAFVTDIIEQHCHTGISTAAIVNCMSIKSTADFTQTIAKDLELALPGKDGVEALKSIFLSKSTADVFLLVLDEIDRLVDLDLNLLYSLFEWSSQPASRLILIGIANALDLTDRLLPRLKSRRIKPALLPFMPYTATQINEIITAKLKSLKTDESDPSYVPFLQPAAILLCSKKVSSQTGDLRRAFDIVRRAITLAESEARTRLTASPEGTPSKSPLKTPLSENVNLSSPPVLSPSSINISAQSSSLTAENAPRATIAHVAKITSQIFSNGTSSRLGQLSIQQKAVLCVLASSEKKSRSALSHALSSMTSFLPATPSKSGRGKDNGISSRKLYDTYSEICKKDNVLHALSSVEFKDVLSGLETLSLMEFVDANGKGTLGLLTPSRTPSRKSKKNDFGQMSLGIVTGGDDRKLSSVVGFVELRDSLKGPGSDILLEILEG